MTITNLQKGDYVLATKWGDGDPQDHWCVGFFSHMLKHGDLDTDRYIIVDGDGVPFRANGFRRVRRVSRQRGKWLLDNAKWIELSGKSLWHWVRQSILTPNNPSQPHLHPTPMKITNLIFDPDEAASIKTAALIRLSQLGHSKRQALEMIEAMSPPNLLRLALGLPLKHRGGRRDRAGRPRSTPSN